MSSYLLPGLMGLITGILLHWAGFSRPEGLRRALGLRRSLPLRSGLSALGYALTFTALLIWLAVIDVDIIPVLPLSLGAILGGMVLGLCCGLCGFTPGTAFAGVGAGPAPEALCTLAGCLGMTCLLPTLSPVLSPLQTAAPYAAATLFRVTLDESFLLEGGFLGLACAGLLLVGVAVCIPSPRPVPAEIPPAEAPTPEEAPVPPETPDEAPAPEEAPGEDDAQQESPDEEIIPEEAAGETFVALLEGEEPLVVDTEPQEEKE